MIADYLKKQICSTGVKPHILFDTSRYAIKGNTGNLNAFLIKD